MNRYRTDQIWSDPTGNYGYIVRGIDPLDLIPWGIPSRRLEQRALDELTDDEREERFPRVHLEPEATPDEIRAGLVGRTITHVEVERVQGSFPQGDGALTLTLDDGNTVGISGWGYDAWGTDVHFDAIPQPIAEQETP